MFYFSEEPNCRKNKQVVSRPGSRSNTSGISTHQTSDLHGACRGPKSRCGRSDPRAPAGSPTPGPPGSQDRPARPRRRAWHPCTRARGRVTANRPWSPCCRGGNTDGGRERGGGEGERELSSPPPPPPVSVPFLQVRRHPLPPEKPCPAAGTARAPSQPQSNGNGFGGKRHRTCRCLNCVGCAATLAGSDTMQTAGNALCPFVPSGDGRVGRARRWNARAWALQGGPGPPAAGGEPVGLWGPSSTLGLRVSVTVRLTRVIYGMLS